MSEENTFLTKVYHLKEDPFASRSGISHAELYVGREREKKIWTKVVNSSKIGSGSSLNFIIGDYGYGKTSTLYVILEQFKDDSQVLGVYIKLLREDLTARFGVDFIQRIFGAIDIDNIDKLKARKALNNPLC